MFVFKSSSWLSMGLEDNNYDNKLVKKNEYFLPIPYHILESSTCSGSENKVLRGTTETSFTGKRCHVLHIVKN